MDSTALLGGFQELGSGFEYFWLERRRLKLVRSVPMELNKDHNEILEITQVCFEKLVVLKLKRQSDCIK